MLYNCCPQCKILYDIDHKPIVICQLNHMFCQSCLDQMKRKQYKECPICQQRILKNFNHNFRLIDKQIKILRRKNQQQKNQYTKMSDMNEKSQFKEEKISSKLNKNNQFKKPIEFYNGNLIFGFSEINLSQIRQITNQVNKVVIKYGFNCEELKNLLSKMPNLTILKIQWSPFAFKNQLLDLLRILRKLENFKILYLDCDNGFNSSCINQAVKIFKLEELHYGMNICQGIVQFGESDSFREVNKQPNYQPLQDQLKLVRNLSKLKNIWISTQSHIVEIVSSRQWQHIVIGKTLYQVLDQSSWSSLRCQEKLISLGLYHIDQINSYYLSRVIRRNQRTLKSFLLYECSGLNEEGIAQLKECQRLQSLYFCKIDVQGQSLSKLSKLVHLHLNACKMNSKHILSALSKMDQLKYLTLSKNKWITNQFIGLIRKIQTLQHLNLYGCSKISDEEFYGLKNLKLLTSLHIGQTSISNQILQEIIKSYPKMKKIGLKNLSINQETLCQIGQAMPQLTHIDLRDCSQINGQSLIDQNIFPNLKYIDLLNCYSGIKVVAKSKRKGIKYLK